MGNFWKGIIVFLLVVVVVMIWLASPEWMDIACGWMGFSCPVSFGETYIALNALFSSLVVLGILLLLASQHSRQKDLVRMIGEAGKKQENPKGDKPVDALVLQGFENTFFQMFGLYRDAIASVTLAVDNPDGTTVHTGIRAFDVLKTIGYYDENYKKYASRFQIYLRMVYRLLHFIRMGPIPNRNKPFYAAIFSSQLTDSELHFLFFNALQEEHQGTLKPLVEEYGILEYIDFDRVWPRLMIEYAIGAFGENARLRGLYAEEMELHTMLESDAGQREPDAAGTGS